MAGESYVMYMYIHLESTYSFVGWHESAYVAKRRKLECCKIKCMQAKTMHNIADITCFLLCLY